MFGHDSCQAKVILSYKVDIVNLDEVLVDKNSLAIIRSDKASSWRLEVPLPEDVGSEEVIPEKKKKKKIKVVKKRKVVSPRHTSILNRFEKIHVAQARKCEVRHYKELITPKNLAKHGLGPQFKHSQLEKPKPSRPRKLLLILKKAWAKKRQAKLVKESEASKQLPPRDVTLRSSKWTLLSNLPLSQVGAEGVVSREGQEEKAKNKTIDELQKEVASSYVDGYEELRDQVKNKYPQDKFPDLDFDSLDPSLSEEEAEENEGTTEGGIGERVADDPSTSAGDNNMVVQMLKQILANQEEWQKEMNECQQEMQKSLKQIREYTKESLKQLDGDTKESLKQLREDTKDSLKQLEIKLLLQKKMSST
ncbi:unnamed protein product [Ilex paraguariensis]|uniref:Uncharacterized protein n=1 Tax=Ilex paraguariensis TaxID=185542 RepID=A0ABC8U811_9AQUA